MKATFALALIAVAGCAPAPATPAPAGPRAADEARRALDHLRACRSLRTRFESTIAPAKGDALTIRGEAVSVAGGVAFVRYRSSGGDVKQIVRAGSRAWAYHAVAEEWVAAEELGMSGAGRGVQSLDGVIAVLLRHADTAVRAEKDVFSIPFAGADLEVVMREHAAQGAFVWAGCSAEARLHLDTAGTIRSVRVGADLLGAEGASLRYEADVHIESVNADWSLRFDVPLAPHVRDAILGTPAVPAEVVRALRE